MTERVANQGPKLAASHPEVDDWLAYHNGKLAEDAEERLRGHLVACPDCVSLLLDIEAFHHSPAAQDVSELELASAWREFRRRNSTPAASRRWRWRRRLPWAASLVVGVLGAAGWFSEHRTSTDLEAQLAALQQPQLNVPIYDLYHDTTVRSGGEQQRVVVDGDSLVTLVLHLDAEPQHSDLEVEIGRGATVVWRSRGLQAHPDFFTVKLALPQGFLEAGEHRVRLYGVDGDERILLEEFPPIAVQL